MDHLDLVRTYFRALNRGAAGEVVTLFSPDCIVEQPFPISPAGETLRGRKALEEAVRRLQDEYAGALPGGGYLTVRTVGGIGTGWGWGHAEWSGAFLPRAGGEPRRFRGYTHFLVEDGRIRRLRTVAAPAPADAAAEEAPRAERRYPARPIVGVGAVILVDEGDAAWLNGLQLAGKAPAVVLIKRRYEPLAGQWSLPGGMLETGETLEHGVAREILEETGLVIEVGPVVEVFDRILLDPDQRVRHHYVLVDYLCRARGGMLQAGSDVSEVAIADPRALAAYAVAPKVDAVVRRALEMTRP